MLLHIDLQSDTPIYTQITEQIIEGIAKKQLAANEPLPSVRSLAADLGINLHTVNKAYTILKQEGYVHIHRQKGVTVSNLPLPPADDLYCEMLRARLRPLVAEATCRQMDEKAFAEQCKRLFQEFNT